MQKGPKISMVTLTHSFKLDQKKSCNKYFKIKNLEINFFSIVIKFHNFHLRILFIQI